MLVQTQDLCFETRGPVDPHGVTLLRDFHDLRGIPPGCHALHGRSRLLHCSCREPTLTLASRAQQLYQHRGPPLTSLGVQGTRMELPYLVAFMTFAVFLTVFMHFIADLAFFTADAANQP